VNALICWHMCLISVFSFLSDLDKLLIVFICALSVIVYIYICGTYYFVGAF
jgi:hypothetical protein